MSIHHYFETQEMKYDKSLICHYFLQELGGHAEKQKSEFKHYKKKGLKKG